MLLLGSCAPAPKPGPVPVAAAHPLVLEERHLVALLAGGDEPVFEHAIRHLRDLLHDSGVPLDAIHLRKPTESLTLLLRALPPPEADAGGSCLVYISSHGASGQGVAFDPTTPPVQPAALDQALDVACGAVPTVVVISACYAGQFALPPMTRPNRIILTAARADRASFGCARSLTYTFFDDCFLGALPAAAQWQIVFARVRGCISTREALIDAEPSEPQAWFGAAVTDLPTPWHQDADPDAILFTPAPGGPGSSVARRLGDEPEWRAQKPGLAHYDALPLPKALVVTPSGFMLSVSQDRSGRRSRDDVARLALQRCEWLTGGACTLFAWDDSQVKLLPSGLAPLHPPVLVRSGPVDPEKTPFIRDDQRPAIAQYQSLPPPKALALSPGNTALAIGTGSTLSAARQEALNTCRGVGHDCVIYAEDDQVVLGWGR